MTHQGIRGPAAALVLAIAIVAPVGGFVDSVKITLPAAVTFAVTNVSSNTTGSPNPASVSFTQFSTPSTNVFRISVKADSDFVPPSGASIPASNVSWTTSNVSNGTASNGMLSVSAYTQVYQSNSGKKSGGVDMHWLLGAPGAAIRAGAHTLVLRWKLESI